MSFVIYLNAKHFINTVNFIKGNCYTKKKEGRGGGGKYCRFTKDKLDDNEKGAKIAK